MFDSCNKETKSVTALNLFTLFHVDFIQLENLASFWMMTTQKNKGGHTFGLLVAVPCVSVITSHLDNQKHICMLFF